jgi:hypothetical protein
MHLNSLLPVVSSVGGTGAGRLRLIETLDCFTLVSLSSLAVESEIRVLGGLGGGPFRSTRGGLGGVPSELLRSGHMGCSGLMTLAVTVTRGGFVGIALAAGVSMAAGVAMVSDVALVAGADLVAGFGGSSLVLFRGSLKNRPPLRLDRGSFTDGKTFSDSMDLTSCTCFMYKAFLSYNIIYKHVCCML